MQEAGDSGADWSLHPWRHNNVWGVTAGQARHNSSNVGGQVGHNSSFHNGHINLQPCHRRRAPDSRGSLDACYLDVRAKLELRTSWQRFGSEVCEANISRDSYTDNFGS